MSRKPEGGNVANNTKFSRRQFLTGAAALALTGRLRGESAYAVPQQATIVDDGRDVALINGRIHTMDANNRVVSQALIRNGRFIAVSDNIGARGANVRT